MSRTVVSLSLCFCASSFPLMHHLFLLAEANRLCIFFQKVEVSVSRKCRGCALTDHDARNCPIIKKPVHPCVCKKATCATCSTECSKCNQKGHAEYSIKAPIPDKGLPTFVCSKIDNEDLQAHVRECMEELPLTTSQQKNQRSSAKRRLAATRPSGASTGNELSTHGAQAELVDLTGLGGASASPTTKTAEASAAAAIDEGASRAAARIVGAYMSDATHSAAAASVPPPPGVVADGVLAGDRAAMYARIDSTLSVQRKYTPALNTAMGRMLKKVGVSRGGGATTEVLGSANPFFKWSGAQLRTAGITFMQQTYPVILTQVRDTLTLFAIKRFFNGAGVTSAALSCDVVEESLVECARESGLHAFPVIALLEQFVREIRMGTVTGEGLALLCSFSAWTCACRISSASKPHDPTRRNHQVVGRSNVEPRKPRARQPTDQSTLVDDR